MPTALWQMVLAVPLMAGLSGCAPQAPITRAQAETICVGEALNPPRPRGQISIGTGFGGGNRSYGAVSMDIPAGAFTRRSPEQVFAACVQNRAGVPPATPLSQQPGWVPV